MPRLTRAVPVRPVAEVELVISDTVNPSCLRCFAAFATEPVAARIARNDPFALSLGAARMTSRSFPERPSRSPGCGRLRGL